MLCYAYVSFICMVLLYCQSNSWYGVIIYNKRHRLYQAVRYNSCTWYLYCTNQPTKVVLLNVRHILTSAQRNCQPPPLSTWI